MRLRALSAVAAAIAVVALNAAISNAALLVHDPFGYAGGSGDYLLGNGAGSGVDPIGGQNPVTSPDAAFYAGGWIESAASAVKNPNGPHAPGIMNYPNFPRSGGLVTDDDEGWGGFSGRNGREFASPLGGGRGARTIYQSFLVDFGTGAVGVDEGKRGVEWWNGGVGDSFLAIDLAMYQWDTEFDLQVTTAGNGTVRSAVNGGGLDLGDVQGVNLIVMKFEFNPADGTDPLATTADDDIVTMYLNPTDSVEANWTPAASVAVNASDLVLTGHSVGSHFTWTGGHIKPMRFDELRWGDTFADVTPFVPEPTSLTLMGLSVAGLLLGRRR
jgi:hypothetical protein